MKKISSGNTPKGGQAVYSSNGIKFLRSQNIYNDGLKLDNVAYISEDIHMSKPNSHVCAKDILLNITGASIGRCALVPADFDTANTNQHILIMRLVDDTMCQYVHTVMTSQLVYNQIMDNQVGGTKEGLSAERANNILLPIPPYNEQCRIHDVFIGCAKHIDNICLNKQELSKFIKQAKAKVLDLAIRGKLVSQDPTDEPASVLLERIKAEKEAANKPSKRGAKNTSTTSDNSHYPYEIPERWIWCKLNDICIINPRNNISDDTNCSFIPMPMIADGFKNKHTFEIRKWSEVKKGFTHFRNNDLAIAKITPCFENRKSVVLKNLEAGAGAGTTEIFILRPVLYPSMSEYLLLLAKTNQFISGGIANFNGAVGQQRVTREYIETYNISLPPLNEQKRIVAKVNEIFEQLDSIEKALME